MYASAHNMLISTAITLLMLWYLTRRYLCLCFSQLPLLYFPLKTTKKEWSLMVLYLWSQRLCVHAVEFSNDISNWKVQGHPYIYTRGHSLRHYWQCEKCYTAFPESQKLLFAKHWIHGVLQESKNGKSPGLFCVRKIPNCPQLFRTWKIRQLICRSLNQNDTE